jgi:hypothetical protein
MGKSLRHTLPFNKHLALSNSSNKEPNSGLGLPNKSAPLPGLFRRNSTVLLAPRTFQKDQTRDSLFEDPRADAVAQWIAARTVTRLDNPNVLDPLIDLLLDRVISEPVADLATRKTPGDFSRRPIKTKTLHNLADYETFGDLYDLPTGASTQNKDGSEVEFFVDLIASHCYGLVMDTLKSETRDGLAAAPGILQNYLDELVRRDALEEFAETVMNDLAVTEQFDEFNLVNDLASLPFAATLLKKWPEQASRFAKNQVASRPNAPHRREQLKLARIIDNILRNLAEQPSGLLPSGIGLFNQILRQIRNIEDFDTHAKLDFFELLRILARDERLLALLPKRGRRDFQRDVTHWLHQAEQGEQDFTHPLVSLFEALDQGNLRSEGKIFVSIEQDKTTSTFHSDNWPFFLAYALGPGDPALTREFKITITRSEKSCESEVYSWIETSAGLLVSDYDANYLTAEQFRDGHGAHLTSKEKNAIIRITDAENLIFT